MKSVRSWARERLAPYLPPVLSAAALVVFTAAFIGQFRSFRESVVRWANRDLKTRSELAATSLAVPLATDDFRKIREFGEFCNRDGMRLTVTSGGRGGMVFDSRTGADEGGEMFRQSSPCGDYRVSVGMPVSEVLRPFNRAVAGFALAALVGVAGVLLFFFVIYRQRVRIRELSRVERFRREFIADFSHELKTPLTGMIGAVELLEDAGPMSGENRAELLKMIRGEAGRVNDLAQGILTLARLERDGMQDTIARENADIGLLVKECVGRFAIAAAGSGVEIVVTEAGNDVAARCDAALLARAVDNLIANALMHSGSKRIEVSAARKRDSVAITVEDHGVGIDGEHRARIFERFYRVDRSRDGKSGGSGLGLAIAGKIAGVHGGSLVLEPKDGPGARFVLTFPA